MKSVTDINAAIDRTERLGMAAIDAAIQNETGRKRHHATGGWPVIVYLIIALAALLLMILASPPARSADRDLRGDFRHDGRPDYNPPRDHGPRHCPPVYLGAGVWGPGNCEGGGRYVPRPPIYGPNWNNYRPQPYPQPQPYVAPVPFGGRYWRGQWYPQIVGSPCWLWTGSGWGWNCPDN